MITLIKKALVDKKFYRTGYKKVSRKRAISFLLFICLFYSLIVSPLNTYSGFNSFLNFKKEVLKLPTALNVEIKNGELKSNFSKPVLLVLASDSVLVVDPENKFTAYETNKSYLVFKQKGLVTVYNNEFSNQEYKGISDFKINSKILRDYVVSLNIQSIVLTLGISYVFYNFISILLEIIFTILIFSGVYYFLSKFIIHSNSTFLQICKRFLFLSIYLCFGFALCDALGLFNSYVPILIFGVAYFLFIARNTKKI